MLIRNDFEVAEPVEKVWAFFGDIPHVAACLPGAEAAVPAGLAAVSVPAARS